MYVCMYVCIDEEHSIRGVSQVIDEKGVGPRGVGSQKVRENWEGVGVVEENALFHLVSF